MTEAEANLQYQLDQAMSALDRIAALQRTIYPGIRTLSGDLCGEAWCDIVQNYKNVPVVPLNDPTLPAELLVAGVAYETEGPEYHNAEYRRDGKARLTCQESYAADPMVEQFRPDEKPHGISRSEWVATCGTICRSHAGRVVDVLIRIEPDIHVSSDRVPPGDLQGMDEPRYRHGEELGAMGSEPGYE